MSVVNRLIPLSVLLQENVRPGVISTLLANIIRFSFNCENVRVDGSQIFKQLGEAGSKEVVDLFRAPVELEDDS